MFSFVVYINQRSQMIHDSTAMGVDTHPLVGDAAGFVKKY
jgi:hypothetical protein